MSGNNTQEGGPGARRAMERWGPCPVEHTGRPRREARQRPNAKPAGQGVAAQEAPPIRVKKEELSDVPCKVPRFQYVDFPSLHQCIQQLAVPPLDSWLAKCGPIRPTGPTAANSEGREPKFKYVDYPSLHHCIQQLSVPPLESWSAGLLRSEAHSAGNAHIQAGSGRPLTHGAMKQEWANGAEAAAETHKLSATAILPADHPTVNTSVSNTIPCEPPVLSGSDVGRAQLEMGGKGDPSAMALDPILRPICLAVTQLSANEGGSPVPGLRSVVEPDQTQLGGLTKLSGSPRRVFWRTVPEAVCPFCQKMFADPDELKVHQRSHRDKKPH
ncbi:uncharacterized protein LOC108918747 [Scleropages formosus]|uniref:uncharacterized protein LOC108918747 n=1 Tax=Scleropages formosus TaxID=113540 RepID=UPI0008783E4E|nr:uncharacterized protein LOC108918747 [Scleropages formosus]